MKIETSGSIKPTTYNLIVALTNWQLKYGCINYGQENLVPAQRLHLANTLRDARTMQGPKLVRDSMIYHHLV